MGWVVRDADEHHCNPPFMLPKDAQPQDVYQCDGCAQYFVVEDSQRDGLYLVKSTLERAKAILRQVEFKREQQAKRIDEMQREKLRQQRLAPTPTPSPGVVHRVDGVDPAHEKAAMELAKRMKGSNQ